MQYAEGVDDVTGGFVPVTDFAHVFLPDIAIQPLEQNTHTANAFEIAFRVFREEIADWTDFPAPVLCHITDGEFNDRDPTPAAERIRNLAVDDGNVLVCNTYIAVDVLGEPVRDAKLWRGVTRRTSLSSKFARTLRDMSSDLPASYREAMHTMGYSMGEDAVMMVPGVSTELIQLALVMAQSTPHRGPA